MREEEDQFRHYVPLLRRIIILVAVVAAIPVVLWTITAFVRAYVGPPKLPTFRPMSATASIAAPAGAGATADNGDKQLTAAQLAATGQSLVPTIDGRATATDPREGAPAAKGPLLGDRPADGDVNATATASKVADLIAAVPADANLRGADTASAAATPGGAPTDVAAGSAQPPPAGWPDPATDAGPAAAPLTGPVPLPRHRPRDLAMAQLGVPVPRPRPEAIAASEPSSGPIDWLRNIFQPQQQPTQPQ